MQTPHGRRQVALAVAVGVASAGCPSFRPGVLPSAHLNDYPNRTTQEGVSVALQPLDETQTRATFGANLLRKGIQPLQLVIHNASEGIWRFEKAAVDPDYVPAERAAKAAYRHTVLRTALWSVLVFPIVGIGFLLPPLLWAVTVPVTQGYTSSKINQEIHRVFTDAEIPDTNLGPEGHAAGVMFIKPKGRRSITVTLTEESTRKPLVFHFPL